MDNKELILEKIVTGYIVAMLWSSCETHPTSGDDLESLEDFEPSQELKEKALEICTEFYNKNESDCILFSEQYQPSQNFDVWECLGHDLWLTSAGHGVGFWDRGLSELGDRLTEACKEKYCRDKSAYLGDDLLIYLG